MVEIALREKSIPFTVRELSFAKGEHKTPDMLALNPRGTIPVLTVDGAVLCESLAMLEHIDEVCPEPPLLGTDAVSRGQARNRLHESATVKQRGMSLFAYLMRTPDDQRDQARVHAMFADLCRELDIWNGYYERSGWAAGSALSLADITIYAYLATASHLGLSMTGRFAGRFDALADFVARMVARPSVTEGWPWTAPADETPLAKLEG